MTEAKAGKAAGGVSLFLCCPLLGQEGENEDNLRLLFREFVETLVGVLWPFQVMVQSLIEYAVFWLLRAAVSSRNLIGATLHFAFYTLHYFCIFPPSLTYISNHFKKVTLLPPMVKCF